MTLHTVNKSPLSSQTLASCLRVAAPGDTVLLIEDGVYACTPAHESLFDGLDVEVKLRVLREDLLARGLEAQLAERFDVVDYAGFVELACAHPRTLSWF